MPEIRRQRREAPLHGNEFVLGPWPRTGGISGGHGSVSLGQGVACSPDRWRTWRTSSSAYPATREKGPGPDNDQGRRRDAFELTPLTIPAA